MSSVPKLLTQTQSYLAAVKDPAGGLERDTLLAVIPVTFVLFLIRIDSFETESKRYLLLSEFSLLSAFIPGLSTNHELES